MLIMMSMKTQFGDMIITDDNKTIAGEKLQKEINNIMTDNKKPEFTNPELLEITKSLDK